MRRMTNTYRMVRKEEKDHRRLNKPWNIYSRTCYFSFFSSFLGWFAMVALTLWCKNCSSILLGHGPIVCGLFDNKKKLCCYRKNVGWCFPSLSTVGRKLFRVSRQNRATSGYGPTTLSLLHQQVSNHFIWVKRFFYDLFNVFVLSLSLTVPDCVDLFWELYLSVTSSNSSHSNQSCDPYGGTSLTMIPWPS